MASKLRAAHVVAVVCLVLSTICYFAGAFVAGIGLMVLAFGLEIVGYILYHGSSDRRSKDE